LRFRRAGDARTFVIPAKAAIQFFLFAHQKLDSGLRRNDWRLHERDAIASQVTDARLNARTRLRRVARIA